MVAVLKHSFGGVYTHGADILVDPHTDFRLEQTVQMGAVIADGFGDMLCGKALSGVLRYHPDSLSDRHGKPFCAP